MMADEREQAELLATYRAVLTEDPAAAPPDDLDPDLAVVARRLARHPAGTAPDAVFVATLRRRLGLSRGAAALHEKGYTPSVTTTGPERRRPDLWPVRPQRPIRQATGRVRRVVTSGANGLAVAALVAVFVLGLVLVLGSRGGDSGAGAGRTTSGPPGSGVPTPLPARDAALLVAGLYDKDAALRQLRDEKLLQPVSRAVTVNSFTVTVWNAYVATDQLVVLVTIEAPGWFTTDQQLNGSVYRVVGGAGREYRPSRVVADATDHASAEAFFFPAALPADLREETVAFIVTDINTRTTLATGEPTSTPHGTGARAQARGRTNFRTDPVGGPWEIRFTLPVQAASARGSLATPPPMQPPGSAPEPSGSVPVPATSAPPIGQLACFRINAVPATTAPRFAQAEAEARARAAYAADRTPVGALIEARYVTVTATERGSKTGGRDPVLGRDVWLLGFAGPGAGQRNYLLLDGQTGAWLQGCTGAGELPTPAPR